MTTTPPYDPGPVPPSAAVVDAAREAFKIRSLYDDGVLGIEHMPLAVDAALLEAVTAALQAATAEDHAAAIDQAVTAGIPSRTRQAETRIARAIATAQAYADKGSAPIRRAAWQILEDLQR